MTDQEALQLFKCLADRSRLQILKSLSFLYKGIIINHNKNRANLH